MRLRKSHSDAEQPSGSGGARRRRPREGRGWGPFSGGQLTIVIVTIAAMFAIPTAALAAGGAFSNNSATVPAVKATNANAHGIGVQGTGKKYGVLSNGPLGVAAGKPLSCTGCVGPTALSASAKVPQPLGSGQSESGFVSGGGGDSNSGYIGDGVTFTRPVTSWASIAVTDGSTDPTHCPGVGQAAGGFFCLYDNSSGTSLPPGGLLSSADGGYVFWVIGSSSAFAAANYTVRAP